MRLSPRPRTAERALRGWSRRGRGVLLSLLLRRQRRHQVGPAGAPGALLGAIPTPGAPLGAGLLLIISERDFSCPGGTELSAILALHQN
ncbi:hypothetical protein NDU88_006275 [Pleurodeles waltl]|uniref:Uncharacterized protein n=1 Tax=Pleurodeles waltl TaxID=8319 RepID=A0AAV7QI91_PLEWA|nr:hypothetical protein NDU88_006275 [Pleurodeles waltl]